MKKYHLLLLGILFSCCLFAQQGLNKGKIFTQEKVLEGYIMISTYESTPQQFSFSIDKKGPFTQVPAASIIKVEYESGITFERYFLKIAVINKDFIERTRDDYTDPGNLFSGTVFVQKLIAGPFSLFQFNDQYGYSHFFYKTMSDTGLVYLPNKSFEEGGTLKDDASFRNQVNFLIKSNNCNKAGNADRLEYETYSMTGVFKKLNLCTGKEFANLNKNNKFRFGGGGYLGLVSNKVSFSNTTKTERNVVPSFGVFLSAAPKYNLKSIIFGLEINSLGYTSTSDTVQLNSFTKRVDHIKYPLFQVASLLRVYLSRKSPNFFFEGGPSVAFGINGKLKMEYFVNNVLNNSTTTSLSSRMEFYFPGGFGVEISRVSIQARYCTNFSLSPSINYFGVLAKVSFF